MARAVVLLSGGLDSATVLAVAKNAGFDVYAISFDYGQLHRVELEFARKLAGVWGVSRHLVFKLGLGDIGGSALTDSSLEVPKGRADEEMSGAIPATYVPARNMTFLSIAVAWAEVLGARDVFVGVNAVDYSGYPDCRPEFIAAMESVANLATRVGVTNAEKLRIRAPLIDLTKEAIIAEGLKLGVDYSLTSTCYDPSPSGRGCGACDACRLRIKGFEANGMSDPAMVRG